VYFTDPDSVLTLCSLECLYNCTTDAPPRKTTSKIFAQAKGKFTMAAFSIDSKKLIKAALEQMSPGMEHVCILPAVTFVKLTRIINLVQSETTVTAAGSDECPPGSLDLDKNAVPQD